MRTQEPFFVEHAREHSPETGFVENRKHPAALHALALDGVNVRDEIRPPFEKAADPLHQGGMLLDELPWDDADGTERQKSDE